MRKPKISRSLKERIAKEAHHRCGYCHTREAISGIPLTIEAVHEVTVERSEHLIPSAAGGSSNQENLWLACRPCNEFKGARTHALDNLTGRKVRLFNPRKQQWKRHFEWSADGTRIIGKTDCGRATVAALRMNHVTIVIARQNWVVAGWHPPKDDMKNEI